MSADANHITQPLADGAALAMRQGASPTPTPQPDAGRLHQRPRHRHPANDAVEAAAIHQAFGASRLTAFPSAPPNPCTATPSEPAEPLEALATVLALHAESPSANAGVTQIDPAINLDIILGEPRATSHPETSPSPTPSPSAASTPSSPSARSEPNPALPKENSMRRESVSSLSEVVRALCERRSRRI